MDLAVIVVNAKFVLSTVDECAARGIKGLVVISAGFKETGGEGRELEEALAAKVRANGMRMVGPNCLGVVNTNPNVRLDACFAESLPVAGDIGFVSQSGALGGGILNILKDLNVGFAQFISIGNQADVNAETALEYWENDPDVKQILLYMESIPDPANFRKLATRISKKKPIVALKAGRSAAGASAASSHTGSLAGGDRAADALLKQSGVIREMSLKDLFSTAKVFANCPIPKGDRVAIVTNSGGPGIMATDAVCEFDMVMVIYLPFLGLKDIDVAGELMRIRADHPEKPIVGVFMTKSEFFQQLSEMKVTVPFYMYSEEAAEAFCRLNQQRLWQARPEGVVPQRLMDEDRALSIFKAAAAEGRRELTTRESLEVLDACGVRTCRSGMAHSEAEAVELAARVGYPIVMKMTSKSTSHKTDVGGVRVGIADEAQLRTEYQDLLAKLEAKGLLEGLEGVIIQEMVKSKRELVTGIATDPQMGPMIMFGLGGVFVEVLKDVAFRIAPLTDIDAQELIRSVKAVKLLEGARGMIPAQMDKVEDTLLRISQLADQHRFVKELDINPLMVSDKDGEPIAVDARIAIDVDAVKAL